MFFYHEYTLFTARFHPFIIIDLEKDKSVDRITFGRFYTGRIKKLLGAKMNTFRKVLAFLFLLTVPFSISAAEKDVLGLWKIINDKTGKARSIVCIYEYEEKLYGRIIITLDDSEQPYDTIDKPEAKAEKLPEQPYYSGLDIIWDLTWKKDKWEDGKILDAEDGKVYNAEIWYNEKKNQLVIKGKVGPFSGFQYWIPAAGSDIPAGFILPDTAGWIPRIPRTD